MATYLGLNDDEDSLSDHAERMKQAMAKLKSGRRNSYLGLDLEPEPDDEIQPPKSTGDLLIKKQHLRKGQTKMKTGAMKEQLREILIGQDQAIEKIMPAIHLFQAGLRPGNQPAGAFLLAGPTGVGKTHTVEALAQVLHGNSNHYLRVDCGEFQMDHEVAKLIGAPPGYLGHRETQAFLNQNKINSFSSATSGMTILLFDEIEKAAPAMARLLLSILDKSILRLGDNTSVNFDRCIIFLTSNLGARKLQEMMSPTQGFAAMTGREAVSLSAEAIFAATTREAKRHFSPEFFNRLTDIIAYGPLSDDAFASILDRELEIVQQRIDAAYGSRSGPLVFTEEAKAFLLERGISKTYGARELRRVINKFVVMPLAEELANKGGSTVISNYVCRTNEVVAFDVAEGGEALKYVIEMVPAKKTKKAGA